MPGLRGILRKNGGAVKRQNLICGTFRRTSKGMILPDVLGRIGQVYIGVARLRMSNATGCSRCSSPRRTGTAFLFWTNCVAHRPESASALRATSTRGRAFRLRTKITWRCSLSPRSPVPASNLTPGNLLFFDQLALAAGFLLSRHVTPPLLTNEPARQWFLTFRR